MEISIIIPIYNAAKHLTDCFESIRNQTFQDYEVVLVEDASTDNSLTICQEYTYNDKRWKILRKVLNEGVEKARLDGLQIAQGKYVFFIDADDWLDHANVLNLLYQKAEETQADYVETGVQRVFNRHKWIKKKRESLITGLIENPELFKAYYHSFFGKQMLSVNIWGKLYRKSTIDKVQPQSWGLSMGEDLAFNIQLFPFLERIYIMESIGYNYRYGGMTCGYNPHLYPDLRKLYLQKEKLIEQYHYTQALDSTRIEMTNVLHSDILQEICYHKRSEAEICNRIQQQLKDPIWEKVLQIQAPTSEMNQSFVHLLATNNAQELYRFCIQEHQNKWLIRLIEKIKNNIFTHI